MTQDMVELRIRWYDDGNEGEVLRDLLDRFEADNPDISVEIDTVPYRAILENLPLDLAAGEGPDMARVTDLGGLAEYYLDMTPYLSDPGLLGREFRSLPQLETPARRRLQHPRFHDAIDHHRSLHQPHAL